MLLLDFGDELALESFKIPWLIWIQLIVLLLLMFFLFCFTTSSIIDNNAAAASDPSSLHQSITAAAASPAIIQSLANHHSTPVVLTNPHHITRGVENLSVKGEIAQIESTEIVREDIAEGEASSLYFLHPCYYFRLARVAFLKCLGLDSTSESDNSSNHKHKKEG